MAYFAPEDKATTAGIFRRHANVMLIYAMKFVFVFFYSILALQIFC